MTRHNSAPLQVGFLTLLLASGPALAHPGHAGHRAHQAPDARTAAFSEEERAELLRILDESAAQFIERIEATSEEQWTWRAREGRWSVAECAEHILLSEKALLDTAKQALDLPATDDWGERIQGKEQLLRQVMPNRRPQGQGGATAPQEIVPSGDLGKAETLERFAAQRAEVRQFVEQLQGDVRAHIVEHPFPFFGDLSAYEWTLYIPLHTVRHTRQLIEVQEDPGYPSE